MPRARLYVPRVFDLRIPQISSMLSVKTMTKKKEDEGRKLWTGECTWEGGAQTLS
jgi:hypothetical protein